MTVAKSSSGQGPKLTVVDGTQPSSIGSRLAKARAQQNLSVEDVAKQLNLSAGMVRAIESDNHKALPGRTFVKGYLRNYGKLVGISSDELMRAYEIQFDGELESLPPPTTRHRHWIAPLVKTIGYLILAGIIVLVVMAIYKNFGVVAEKAQALSVPVLRSVTSPEGSAEAAAVVATESNSPSLSLPSPIKSPVPEAAPSTDEASTSVTADTPSIQSEENKSAEIPASPSVPPRSAMEPSAPVVSSPSIPVPQTQNLPDTNTAVPGIYPTVVAPARVVDNSVESASVTLNFLGESWVRVRDARGAVVFSGVKRAGSELQLKGHAPMDIKLGNAPGVKVIYNGAPVEFNVSNSSNVAQFTLGAE